MMRKLSVALLLGSLACLSARADGPEAGKGVSFESGSYADVLAKAKAQQKKGVFLDFSADG
jgi:hypothetical protein